MSLNDPAAIEANIEATREHLKGTVDELADRLRPKEIGRRSIVGAKHRLVDATRTPDGSLRIERIGAAVAAVVAIVGLLALARRRRS